MPLWGKIMDGEIKKFDLSNRLYYAILAVVIGVVGYLAIDMGIYAFVTMPDSTEETIVLSSPP